MDKGIEITFKGSLILIILPGFETLAIRSEDLARISSFDCSASSISLRSAYAAAFDAWLAVSHLSFGPATNDDRAYALAFWPDTRGTTPKVLRDLIRKNDPIALRPEDHTEGPCCTDLTIGYTDLTIV